MNKKIKMVLKGFGYTLGGLALAFGGLTAYDYLKERQQVQIRDREAIKVDINEKRKKILYDSFLEYQHEFFNGNKDRDGNYGGYVDFMARGSLWQGYSNEIKKNIEFWAKENDGNYNEGKRIVVQGYTDLHKMFLDLGVQRINKDITEEDIDDYAERCVSHMRKIAKDTGQIDYQHPAVKEAYRGVVKERAGWIKDFLEYWINDPKKAERLEEITNISKNRGEGYIFKELVRERYTREEFTRILEEYEASKIPLYDAFGKSLENYKGAMSVFVKLFGPTIAKKTGERSREINMKEVERIYSEDAD
jgi:hypothetical protein